MRDAASSPHQPDRATGADGTDASAPRALPPDAALARMTESGYRFGFFQAVRLLAASRGGPASVGGDAPAAEAVRVSPDPASVFPAADVRRVRPAEDGDGPVTLEVGFGGLYGVDAALPNAFHERIASREASTLPLRDFLDVVSHRSYAQLWRAWARYRPEVRGGPDLHAARAAALAGTGGTSAAPVPARDLLPLAARLSAWARNAEGLRALLEHATGHAVRVLENVPRLVHLGERPRLGTARLGRDAVIGERLYDESGKVRIEIGPLHLDAFRDLLPGGAGAARVDALVRLYASDWLDYDVDLLLHAEEAPPLRLGEASSARLGRNAHLGRPRTPLVRRRVRYEDGRRHPSGGASPA